MNSLPLPASQYVRHIIHLSDIHIRTGTPDECRFDEYKLVFDRTIEKVKNITDESTVCIITGDIFHQKLKGDSTSILLFNHLIGGLSNILPVYIIAGNHDFRQDRIDTPDMIEACLYGTSMTNVVHLAKTGVYWANDVAFCTVSIKDTLLTHTAGGVKSYEELPEFPIPDNTPYRTIALFHGTVMNARLDNLKETSEGYSLSWFGDKFDFICLGDIHKTQFDSTYSYGYAGSLIQQTFGEHPTEHGLLMWDVEKRTPSFHCIENDTAFLKLYNNNGIWYTAHKEPLKDVKLPYNLKVRLFGDVPSQERMDELWSMLSQYNVDIHRMKRNITQEGGEPKDDYTLDELEGCMSTEQWVKYLENHRYHYDTSMIDNPSSLLLSEQFKYIKNIKEKNKDISKAINQFQEAQPEQKSQQAQTSKMFRITFVSWSYILCFGRDNHVNLTENDGMTLINGPNGIGKSAFMEIISLGLYGSPLPCRYDSATTSSVICTSKPKNTSSFVRLHIAIGDTIYQIRRTFNYQNRDHRKLNVLSSTIRDTNTGVDIKTKQTEVNNWVASVIGSKDDFLTWCCITQGNDKDFLHLNPKEQRTMIDRTLTIDALHSFIQTLDYSEKSHNRAKKELEEYVLEQPSDSANEEEQSLEDRKKVLNTAKDELQSLKQRLRIPMEQCIAEADNDYEEEADEDPSTLYEIRGRLGTPPKTDTKRRQIDIDAFLELEHPPIKGKPKERVNIPHNPTNTYNEYKYWEKYITNDECISVEQDVSIQDVNDTLSNVQQQLSKERTNVKNTSRAKAYRARENLEYLNEHENTIDEYRNRIERLTKRADMLEDITSELNRLKREREQTKKSLDKTNADVEELPFNPECWACNQNPLIVAQRQLQDTLSSYDTTISQKRDQYQKWDNGKSISYLRKRINEFQKELDTINGLSEQREYLERMSVYADCFDNIDKLQTDEQYYRGQINTIALREHNRCAEQLYIYYQTYCQWHAHVHDVLTERIKRAERAQRQRIIQEDISIARRAKELSDFIENETSEIKVQEENQLRVSEHNRKQQAIREEYDLVCQRLEIISQMHKGLVGYRASLYQDTIIPTLTRLTNQYIHQISTNISLDATFDNEGTFTWSVQRLGNQRVSLEKTSGFERFMIGLSIRIALGLMARVHQTAIPTQMFIDEGFVSMDENNLSRAPVFLNMLIDQRYLENIIVVSHLEKIKSSSDTIIPISRDETTGLSTLKFGTFVETVQKATSNDAAPI